MTKKRVTRSKPAAKRGVFWWNLSITGLGLIVAVAIDVLLSWAGIWAEHEGVAALAHTAVSVAFTAFAIVLASAAGAMRADPRPEQQRRAGLAMIIGFVMMAVPAGYAAKALSFQDREAVYREYSGSAAEEADRRIANDPMADTRERAAAAESLQKGMRPEKAPFDFGSFSWVAFVLVCNMLAVRAARRAEPETPSQAKARKAKAKAPQEPKRGKVQRENVDMTNVRELRA